MSRSPKYSRVRARAEARKRRERERQEREQRRRELDLKRRRMALAEARSLVTARIDEVATRIRARAAGDVPTTVDPEVLLRELEAARRAALAAGDAGEAADLGIAVAAVEARLEGLELEVALHRERQERAGQVAAIVGLCAAVDEGDRRRFAAAEAREVGEQVDGLQALLDHGDLDGFDRAVPLVRDSARGYVEVVRSRRAEHDRLHAELTARVAGLHATWGLLAEDARAGGVMLDETEIVPDAIALVEAKLDSGSVRAGLDLAERTAERLVHTERALDDAIDRVLESHQVMQAVIGALDDMGYTVDKESFRETEDGTMGIKAEAAGAPLNVVVQDSGEGDQRIFYDSPAMASAAARGAPHALRQCQTLSDFLSELNEIVSRRGDLEVDALDWDGRNGGTLPPAHRMRLMPADRRAEERWVVVG